MLTAGPSDSEARSPNGLRVEGLMLMGRSLETGCAAANRDCGKFMSRLMPILRQNNA